MWAGIIDGDEQDYSYTFIYTSKPAQLEVSCYPSRLVQDPWVDLQDQNMAGRGYLGTIEDASGPYEVTV